MARQTFCDAQTGAKKVLMGHGPAARENKLKNFKKFKMLGRISPS